jgi:hypothetical protein
MSGNIDWYLVQFQGKLSFGGLIGITHTTVTMKLRIEKRDLLDEEIFEVISIFGPDFFSKAVRGMAGLKNLGGVTNIPAGMWV